MEGNGRQDVRKADAPPNTDTHVGRQWETLETMVRRDIEKANTSSNTGTHVGRQRETSGDKVPGRRTHQPTKRKQEGRHWETKGDKTKADTLRMR